MEARLSRLEARVVAGALFLAAQLQRLAAVVVAIPVYALSVVLTSVLVGWRRRPAVRGHRPLRAGLWRLRRSPLPLYVSLALIAVAVGWIAATR